MSRSVELVVCADGFAKRVLLLNRSDHAKSASLLKADVEAHRT